MPKVFFPDGKEIMVPQGTLVAEALQEADIEAWLPCGGQGYCGRCRVKLEGSLSLPTEVEQAHLSPGELAQGVRLSCQTRIEGDVRVLTLQSLTGAQILTGGGDLPAPALHGTPLLQRLEVKVKPPTVQDQRPDSERLEAALGGSYRIPLSILSRLPALLRERDFLVTAYASGDELLKLEPGKDHGPPYAVAVDLGTTTMVAYLWDLEKKRCLGTAAAGNPQAVCGDDVISRMVYAGDKEDGLFRLQALAVAGINGLVEELTAGTGVPAREIYQVTLVGNTCMQHLFLGIDPGCLGKAPYVPACRGPVITTAEHIGLNIYPRGIVEFLPNIAGFVGSDALAAAVAVNLAEKAGNTLLVDLGTNGELLLATRDGIFACSTAAGPAFEGAGISAGMRAVPGAIDKMYLGEGGLQWHVIGSLSPRGFCGSGLVDGLAGILDLGIMDASGRIKTPEETTDPGNRYIAPGDRGFDFCLDPEGQVRITQADVRKIQLAKGAVAAGMKTLLDHVGLRFQDLDQIILAGGFGNYLDINNAQQIGLIPQIPPERVHFAGNAAGTGAQMVLLSREIREKALGLTGKIRHLELAGTASFSQAFMEAMFFGPWN
ncbi:MAG TPA: DUF4445 domain-containing protein [Firmicutes bacterium]|nr:DUF4445 domain-containing protein [Bacillota bacterium]